MHEIGFQLDKDLINILVSQPLILFGKKTRGNINLPRQSLHQEYS